ncbi:tRNA preQ1(34) S-adenosylmethionine ribosyltransferase-isomerase QueA [Candidatus Spongiihabitans sp.]|uniref:tRNA preQ1(34) S-adenosylmethionine ribosyltransferase-isomerase QueA n=1 Tax=Candidatus Spongiihabitans sp. TaxID=3101308 RepID=UPI003C7C6D7D
MDISQYDYSLPASLVAQFPAQKRSASRLLVAEADEGYRDIQFENIIDELNPGDLLVVNDTRVLPARMFGKKPSGGKVEIMLERIVDDRCALVMLGSSKPIRGGQALLLGNEHHLASGGEHKLASGDCALTVGARRGQFFELLFPKGYNARDAFERWGCMPLPPYITRAANTFDRRRYQTVYAKNLGAVAAPTAGLHFDQPLIDRLRRRGVAWGAITLHVGAGTFQPVRCQDIRCHRMHHERVEVGEQVCRQIARAKARGGRVIAVGTTVVRALESAAQTGRLTPASMDTDLFIFPGYEFNIVDALVTNFHLPKSTLLIMVSAFAGYERIMAAYRYAINHGYRFYSYGDALFLQRQP